MMCTYFQHEMQCALPVDIDFKRFITIILINIMNTTHKALYHEGTAYLFYYSTIVYRITITHNGIMR